MTQQNIATITLRLRLEHAEQRREESRKAYAALTNKRTKYAKSIKVLLEYYDQWCNLTSHFLSLSEKQE